MLGDRSIVAMLTNNQSARVQGNLEDNRKVESVGPIAKRFDNYGSVDAMTNFVVPEYSISESVAHGTRRAHQAGYGCSVHFEGDRIEG